MELERGKKYKAIFGGKIVEIEVLKRNKTSYSIKLDGEKETLWIDNTGLSIRVNEFVRYSTYTTYKNLRIVSDKEAKSFMLQKNRNICRDNQTVLQKKINELQKQIDELKQQRDKQIEKAEYYNNELLKIEEEK